MTTQNNLTDGTPVVITILHTDNLPDEIAWATFRSEILTPQGYYALKVSDVFTKAVLHYAVWHDIAIPLTKNITYEPMTADQAAAYNNLKTAFSAMEAAFK